MTALFFFRKGLGRLRNRQHPTVSEFTGVKAPKFDILRYRNTDAMKAIRTTELKMPDTVGLSPTLTQKLTHFHSRWK